jgi:phytanoyl-CoA hydroxylase
MQSEFEKNGFVVVPNVFSEQEMSRISADVDCVLSGKGSDLPKDDVVFEPNTDPPRVRNAFRLHLYNDAFLHTAKHPPLVSAVESLLGTGLRLYSSQVFAKPALVGSVVPRHQDMPYWPFAPYEMLSAWIALDDSTIENGCVRYVAGSHKFGILPHTPSGVAGNSLGVADDPRVRALPEIPVEVRRGSCILHHCLTVHRSDANHSPYPRRGLIYVYMSNRVQLVDPSRLKGPADFPLVSGQSQ